MDASSFKREVSALLRKEKNGGSCLRREREQASVLQYGVFEKAEYRERSAGGKGGVKRRTEPPVRGKERTIERGERAKGVGSVRKTQRGTRVSPKEGDFSG